MCPSGSFRGSLSTMAKRKVDTWEFSETSWRRDYAQARDKYQRAIVLHQLGEAPKEHEALVWSLLHETLPTLSDEDLFPMIRSMPHAFCQKFRKEPRIKRHLLLSWLLYKAIDQPELCDSVPACFHKFDTRPVLQRLFLQHLCQWTCKGGTLSPIVWHQLAEAEPAMDDATFAFMEKELLSRRGNAPQDMPEPASPRFQALVYRVMIRSRDWSTAVKAVIQGSVDPLSDLQAHPTLRQMAASLHQLYVRT